MADPSEKIPEKPEDENAAEEENPEVVAHEAEDEENPCLVDGTCKKFTIDAYA